MAHRPSVRAQPSSDAFLWCPQPSVLVRICYHQKSWVPLGLSWGGGGGCRSQFSADCPAFIGARAVGTPAWCNVLPAPSWAAFSGVGVAGIVGPAQLASLAPFVQSSGIPFASTSLINSSA